MGPHNCNGAKLASLGDFGRWQPHNAAIQMHPDANLDAFGSRSGAVKTSSCFGSSVEKSGGHAAFKKEGTCL